jgi:hypothetical protein
VADRSYPRDSLGNEIRKGDLVRVALLRPGLVFQVVDVEPAGQILSPGHDQPIALQGVIRLQALLTVPFAPGTAPEDMYVLKVPEGAKLTTQ